LPNAINEGWLTLWQGTSKRDSLGRGTPQAIAVRLSYAEGNQNLTRGAQLGLLSDRLGKSGRFHGELKVVPALSNLSRNCKNRLAR